LLQANPSAAFEPTIYRPFKSPNRDKSNHATNRLTAVPPMGILGRVCVVVVGPPLGGRNLAQPRSHLNAAYTHPGGNQ
jgi:hypothetical protein